MKLKIVDNSWVHMHVLSCVHEMEILGYISGTIKPLVSRNEHFKYPVIMVQVAKF
jgi:hypothetical protein